MKIIHISGRVGRDAELSTTKGGTSVLRFSVAVDSKKSGEKVTTWFSVAVFGKRGEALERYLTKGVSVHVCGDLEVRTYQAKDGSTKVDVGIVASEIALLGGGERRESRDGGGGEFDRGEEYEADGVPF